MAKGASQNPGPLPKVPKNSPITGNGKRGK